MEWLESIDLGEKHEMQAYDMELKAKHINSNWKQTDRDTRNRYTLGKEERIIDVLKELRDASKIDENLYVKLKPIEI